MISPPDGGEIINRLLFARLKDLVDDAVLQRGLGSHEVIALHILLDALKRVTESVGAYMCFRCDGVVEIKPKPKSIKQFFDEHLFWSGKELD